MTLLLLLPLLVVPLIKVITIVTITIVIKMKSECTFKKSKNSLYTVRFII